jgi:hypothetical protein
MWHVQIEQDQIRPEIEVQLARLAGIRRGLNAREPGAFENTAKYLDVRRLVIDYQDASLCEYASGHVARVTCQETEAVSALTIASADGESGHTTGGAAVYAAWANCDWNNAVSEA